MPLALGSTHPGAHRARLAGFKGQGARDLQAGDLQRFRSGVTSAGRCQHHADHGRGRQHRRAAHGVVRQPRQHGGVDVGQPLLGALARADSEQRVIARRVDAAGRLLCAPQAERLALPRVGGQSLVRYRPVEDGGATDVVTGDVAAQGGERDRVTGELPVPG